MATLNQLLAKRSAAGERYRNALIELRSARVDLAALDLVLNNENVYRIGSATHGRLSSFATPQLDVVALRHPEFAPSTVDGDWVSLTNAAATAHQNAFPTPEED
jgi:hypothetical protein